MPQPFDYTMPNPMKAFSEGLQVGEYFDRKRAEEQAQEQALQQAQRAQQAMQSFFEKPDKTAMDYVSVLMAAPQFKEQLTTGWEALDKEKKDNLFGFGSQVFAALKNNRPDLAEQVLTRRAEALRASDPEEAQAMETLAKMARIDPQYALDVAGLQLAAIDNERFKTVFGGSDPTAFQKDFAFIKNTFGPEAAAEFAQYGRDGIVSIPLGKGKGTYVGPASMAPGASQWREREPSTPAPQQPEEIGGAAKILGNAARAKSITREEAAIVRQSLGKNGQGAFEQWMKDNAIKIIVRSGVDANGRKVVQFEDGTVAYAAD